MGRVSRNPAPEGRAGYPLVTSRMGRVSRNLQEGALFPDDVRHVPHGTCE